LSVLPGVDQSVIRPFQFGDIVLIQRLGRQSTKLNTVQSLLQPQSAIWASLSALIPWNSAKVATYVLRQQDHNLVGTGYLQAQKRPGRPEVEIIDLAPGLDAANGHPVIWEKLVAYYNTVAAQQQIARIYVDVPDQPLLVNTLSHVGFRTYTRQTIWRLARHDLAPHPYPAVAEIRPQHKADEWALRQLYARTVPKGVQAAEGSTSPSGPKPPILDWWQVGNCNTYVLEQQGSVIGAVQVVQTERGNWLQLWADFYNPDVQPVQQLIGHGLTILAPQALHLPTYVGVCDYHGSLGTLLTDYGFAPMTDRAKMMKPVVQWVRMPVLQPSRILEPASPVASIPFVLPTPSEMPMRRSPIVFGTKGFGNERFGEGGFGDEETEGGQIQQ
jgi:hypothetical protein